ncbi:cytochrome c550 [Bacillus methanolicus]|uniref:Cytochrome c550 n=1 Tax=Bacillus methanolicus (strain MGA3 / ATCC 53907) TaxID=796606 RepID=I3EAL1_BACMM|nr:cytochrome c [Bacillus methanolicus]AIE60771.1 cytochrome c550 [Bacillus methanolicus MGA3]EIJ83532.1 cytochrome c-550 [Bacillus methanolicus MGA3]UQD52781.1 cytochrome c [Bacillus methanolicus]
MNRNPIIPFVLIMVFGIGLMFLLSFKGLGDAKEMAKDAKGGGEKQKTEQVAAKKPEDIYKTTCIGCHGDQYQGGVGPSLKGVGKRLSKAEIAKIVVNGKGPMPSGLVPQEKADEMAEWLSGLK